MEYIQAQSFNTKLLTSPPIDYSPYLKLPPKSLSQEWAPATGDLITIEAFPKSDFLQLIRVKVNYVKSDFVLEDYKPNHQQLAYAIFATNSDGDSTTVDVQGNNWRIQGDVLSYSGVTLQSDNNNKANGDVIYDKDEGFAGVELDIWGELLGEDGSVIDDILPPINYSEYRDNTYTGENYADLGTPTFNFNIDPLNSWYVHRDPLSGDGMVNLNEVDEAWVDPAPAFPEPGKTYYTQLKDGIYYLDKCVTTAGAPDKDWYLDTLSFPPNRKGGTPLRVIG